jgi:two-component system response regulator AtoC
VLRTSETPQQKSGARRLVGDPFVVLGKSAAMAAVRDYLPKVARSDATVLVTGPTGTGKERVASALHAQSRRQGAPFVALNCAAIPDGLLESELFGWERGAFTGAIHSTKGKAALADKGTLFLDEIGEMTPFAQTKLLRLLETREVTPLGAGRAIPIDIRIVAATNQELESLVASRRFRDDLYYRLNVARFTLPPLRERPEDIPIYVDAFIDEFNGRCDAGVTSPTPVLNESLLAYTWPGNVREIRNFVEGVFIDPPRGPIDFENLPPAFQAVFHRTQTASAERDALRRVLERTRWNKAEAAREMNWSRMTLYRKLSKHGLEGDSEQSDDGEPDPDDM